MINVNNSNKKKKNDFFKSRDNFSQTICFYDFMDLRLRLNIDYDRISCD